MNYTLREIEEKLRKVLNPLNRSQVNEFVSWLALDSSFRLEEFPDDFQKKYLSSCSKEQKKIVDYILDCNKRLVNPTISEVTRVLKIRDRSTLRYNILRLVEAGIIEYDPKVMRSLKVLT